MPEKKSEKRGMPIAAWLEDDIDLREETMVCLAFELPGVCINVSGTIPGFWRCLREYSPKLLILDVMLPQTDGIELLSEGVELAVWVRAGRMPEDIASQFGLKDGESVLGKDYSDVPLLFLSARSKVKLERQLTTKGIVRFEVVEKGASLAQEHDDIVDVIVGRIHSITGDKPKPKEE